MENERFGSGYEFPHNEVVIVLFSGDFCFMDLISSILVFCVMEDCLNGPRIWLLVNFINMLLLFISRCGALEAGLLHHKHLFLFLFCNFSNTINE